MKSDRFDSFLRRLKAWLKVPRSNPSKNQAKRTLIVIGLGALFLYYYSVQSSRYNAFRSKMKTKEIGTVLGTRITAVRLAPDKNSTLVQPSDTCNKNAFMVVLIKSIPQNYERRRLIRETWFKTLPKLDVHIEAYFFVGLPQDKNITVISNEASKYGDIIIEDLEENYYLLAVKTLRMLKWFSSNCASRAQYFMKTDDDMFIHFPNLISHINSVPNQWVNYIGGQVHIRDPVNRDPDAKWFAPQDWWPDPYYPPFVSGALTVIASETVPKLLESSLNVPLYHLEDVFLIAMVAFEKLQILPNEIPRIISNSPEWIIRIRMALSSQDMAKTHIAFHCPNDPDLMRELFGRAFSDGINLRNKE